jgi:hypothetical protein
VLGAAPRLLSADAKKPEDWDDDEDGDWEAPRIPNPKCTDVPGCGEWKRPTKAVSWEGLALVSTRQVGRQVACLPAAALKLLLA